MAFTILATADIHIGRRPSHLANPDDAERFSCARMWEAVVERAIRERVDLVALAGDIVDHDNRFFEATGPLERGLRRLAECNIPTYAVAGNHDYDVLPRMADLMPESFHLVGRGGRWEQVIFEPGDGRRLRIHGWSFPRNEVLTSPLVDYDLPAEDDVATLGLLHADLDQRPSKYAPVSRGELESRDVTLWLMGHVHKPARRQSPAGPMLVSPGSPQAMDPGETGPHGPWIVQIDGPHRVEATPLAMSPVRYDALTLALDGVETKEAFQTEISEAVGRHLAAVAAQEDQLKVLSLRLALTGRTPLCARIDQFLGELQEKCVRSANGVDAQLDQTTNNTRPALELRELAEKHDPPGALARLLLDLDAETPTEQTRALLQTAHQKMMEVHRASSFSRIAADAAPDLEAARQTLVHQGMLLLETLRAQQAEV